MGLTPQQLEIVLPEFRYRVELNGIVENEICPVYVARVATDVHPNPLEVEDFRWLKWDEYLKNTQENPKGYSEWSVLQIAQMRNNPLIKKYSN